KMIAVALLLRAKLPQLVFRIFTGDMSELNGALDRVGVRDQTWIKATHLPPGEMPMALMQCDLALALRQPAFSTQGVVPIKLGEYMLAGLPVIGTAGVGYVEPLMKAGVMLPVEDDWSPIWPWVRDYVLPHREAIRKRAQAVGLAYFSLESSVQSYL